MPEKQQDISSFLLSKHCMNKFLNREGAGWLLRSTTFLLPFGLCAWAKGIKGQLEKELFVKQTEWMRM